MFFFLLFLAHLQAVIIPIIFGFKSINKFKNLKNYFLIPFSFVFLGLASLFEMIDHTKTDWIYIDHYSASRQSYKNYQKVKKEDN